MVPLEIVVRDSLPHNQNGKITAGPWLMSTAMFPGSDILSNPETPRAATARPIDQFRWWITACKLPVVARWFHWPRKWGTPPLRL